MSHVGVDHCSLDTGVTEKLLYGADVVACFYQVGRKTVAQGVYRGVLGDAEAQYRGAELLLNRRRIEVEAKRPSGAGLHAKAVRRKEPEPRPVGGGGVGKSDDRRIGLLQAGDDPADFLRRKDHRELPTPF